MISPCRGGISIQVIKADVEGISQSLRSLKLSDDDLISTQWLTGPLIWYCHGLYVILRLLLRSKRFAVSYTTLLGENC